MTKIHLMEKDGERGYYACNKAVGADYRNMTLNKSKITCENCKRKIKNPLTEYLAMMGITAGIGAMMIGGMSKMFGLNDDKGNLKEMTSGLVQGFLEHFEYKIEDLKDQVKRLEEEKKDLEEEKDRYKEQYEDALEMLEKKKK